MKRVSIRRLLTGAAALALTAGIGLVAAPSASAANLARTIPCNAYQSRATWNGSTGYTYAPGGFCLVAPNYAYRAIFQTDGNLVVYRSDNVVMWHSQTYNKGATRLVLQTDGNIVIYRGSTALWNSQTHVTNPAYNGWVANKWTFGGRFVQMQNDGNFVTYVDMSLPKAGYICTMSLWSSRYGTVLGGCTGR